MATVPTAPNRYLAEFESLERRAALRSPSWLAQLRRSAMERVAEGGFPTTRDEDWRYTSLASLAAMPFGVVAGARPDPVPARAMQHLLLNGAEGPRLVFVDGRYWSRHSSRPTLAAGVEVASLAGAIAADGELIEHHLARHPTTDANVVAALSTAFVEDGAFVYVPADTTVPAPIELLFVATAPGALSSPRILVVAGPHSRATVVERYVGLTDEAYFTNAVTEIVAAPGASVDHYVLQEQGAGAFHIAAVHAGLGRDGAFSTCGATFGGRLARTTLTLKFEGAGGRGMLSGLYIVDGRQHVDNHVTVDHAVPRCSSQQLYKGVLDGASRAVFNGRIIVRPDAQKTDANQTNKHLLLSDAA